MCPSCYRYIFVPNQLFVIFVMLEWCLTTLLTKSNVDIEVWPSHSVSVITHIAKDSSSKWEANPEFSFEMWLRKRSLPPMKERALCRICQDGASFVALHYFSMYDTYNIWEHTSSDKPTPFSVSGLHNFSFYHNTDISHITMRCKKARLFINCKSQLSCVHAQSDMWKLSCALFHQKTCLDIWFNIMNHACKNC